MSRADAVSSVEWTEYPVDTSCGWKQSQETAHEDFAWGYMHALIEWRPAERNCAARWTIEVEINRGSREALIRGDINGRPLGRMAWHAGSDSREDASRQAREMYSAIRRIALALDAEVLS